MSVEHDTINYLHVSWGGVDCQLSLRRQGVVLMLINTSHSVYGSQKLCIKICVNTLYIKLGIQIMISHFLKSLKYNIRLYVKKSFYDLICEDFPCTLNNLT